MTAFKSVLPDFIVEVDRKGGGALRKIPWIMDTERSRHGFSRGGLTIVPNS
jgi:hypothetical protein